MAICGQSLLLAYQWTYYIIIIFYWKLINRVKLGSRAAEPGGGGRGALAPQNFQHPKSALFSKWKVPFFKVKSAIFSK